MFGMESNNKPKNFFEFDLEKEIVENDSKRKSLLTEAKGNIEKLNAIMKENPDGESFEDLGVLLGGFTALEKVIGYLKKL
ncbi:MAG: DUF5398 family protein [Simkaniaceae bacterium]|nr:DUF5398 family protein [Simkaniaceae bacterium]